MADRLGYPRVSAQLVDSTAISASVRVTTPKELLEMMRRVESEPERFMVAATVSEPRTLGEGNVNEGNVNAGAE